MNIQKRQSIQKIVIDQTGQDRLILNDLILGYQGAEAAAELIAQYHSNISHIQIKGNNIDAEGFEVLCAALLQCPNLKSIQAQWNSIGTSPVGLDALCHLAKNMQFLQFIDLKNNRIAHNLVDYICNIIQINNKSLKVIDLRWNELGEIGAQAIYKSLASNSALKYIGLEDNRVSMHTLNQVQQMIKNVARGTKDGFRQTSMRSLHRVDDSRQNYFPLSDNTYPSMELQVKNAQTRSKIQNEQNQAQIYQNKLKIQIDKVLQKIKSKGLQIHELQLNHDSLNSQNLSLINQLRETQRLLNLQKQRFIGIDKGLNSQKSTLRTDKYNTKVKIQSLIQKNIIKQQREVEQLEALMDDRHEQLQSIYRERVNKKRANREKLVELKEDVIKLKNNKENSWDTVTDTYQNTNTNFFSDRVRGLQQLIAKSEFQLKSEVKRSQYLIEQLSSTVLKCLQKQDKMQNEIFNTQNEIKSMHNQMGTANVEIEQNLLKSELLQSQIIDLQLGVQGRKNYIKYLQSQTSVNIEIQRLKQQQISKGSRLISQSLDIRISDLQKAIRMQQAQNKMIRNQYEKLHTQIEINAKKTIQSILFEV